MLARNFHGVLVTCLIGVACYAFGGFVISFIQDETIARQLPLGSMGLLKQIVPIGAVALAGTFIPLVANTSSRSMQVFCVTIGLLGLWNNM